MSYTSFYYFAAFILLLGMPVLVHDWHRQKASVLRAVFYFLAISVYLIGMIRSEGVDVSNYQYSYDGNYENGGIPDLGFRILIDLFNFLYLPMQALFLLAGLVSIYAIRKAANYFNVDGTIIFVLYFFHLFVVRDFAQMRMGFAVAIAIVGLTSSLRLKYIFYILAASVHFSVVAFILAYEACYSAARLSSRTQRLFTISVAVTLIFVTGKNIESLAFLDSRIETYLIWDRDGYGREVDSYAQVAVNAGILCLSLILRKNWQNFPLGRCLFYLQLLAISTFFAFHDHAIFAFRLSSVVASLYPVLILLAVSKIPVRCGIHSIGRLTCAFALQFISALLLLRPGSFNIISAIVL